ncbi:hypothetical protein [Bradyrhizobium sp.]|uniref:hypothetical protein n=1 Tax=Bradyrhizobium sp. TaxID=376 RepID=UPI0025C544A8|nr:hypothetical protein [Bradyrhizobium sp.]
MILSDLINRMIAAGVPAGEAGAIAAEIFAAGVASTSFRSSNAERQQRYRDRKSVTKRNETVTPCNAETVKPSVTNRNETVTNRNEVTPPSISLDKNKKKEGRGAQLPDGWRPDEIRWIAACRKLGADQAERELQKFGSHHRAKGTVFKNWNFAWDKWLLNSEEWAPKKGAAVGVVDTSGVDWPAILESYKRYNNWPKGHGNDPTSPSCRAPPELLEKYGLRTMQ